MTRYDLLSFFSYQRSPHYAFRLKPLQPAIALALALPAAAMVQAQEQAYHLPAQSLQLSIQAFSKQTNIQVLYNPDDISDKQGNAVNGNFSSEQALSILLKDTGIQSTGSGNSIFLHPAGSKDAAFNLQAVNVNSQFVNNSSVTEGSSSYGQTGPTATATGLALTQRETPQSITIVTRQKMDDFKLENLKDVLNQTPGVNVYTYGDSIQFQARGEAVQNFQMDGNRSGQALFSSGAPVETNWAMDDMAAIDHIEVLKGSAGLLQGDGNPSATINMIRKKPTYDFQASVGASAGSWDTYRTDVDVSGPLTETGNVRGRAVAAYRDSRSYRDNVKNEGALLYTTVDIDLTPDTLLNLGIDYKKRENRGNIAYQGYQAYNTSGTRFADSSRSWNAAAPWSGYEQTVLSYFATLEHTFDNGWKAKLQLNHESNEIPEFEFGAYHYRGMARAIKPKDLDGSTSNAKLELSGTFDLFGRPHDLVIGSDISKYEYSASESARRPLDITGIDYSSGGNDLARLSGDGWVYNSLIDEDTLRKSFYATTRLNLADDLKLILGARASDYRYKQDWDGWVEEKTETGVVTPFAGIVYDLNQNFSLYASYASVFQPVTVQDEQGRTLDPQEGVTYEVGSKAEFYDGRLNVSLAHFWKRWENSYEVSGGFTPSGNQAYQNVSGVMEHGYELELSGELSPGWQAQGSYVMNNSSLNGSTRTPKQQFKLNTSYQLPGRLHDLTVGLGARWQSKIYTQTYGKLEQDAYWLADAMVRYQITSHLSTSLNVNNIFDKKYYAGVQTMNSWGEYYTWGEPRNMTVSVRYKF